MGFARLFRSRWAALLWSAGIVWTAYDVASTAPTPVADASPANSSTVESGKAKPDAQDATGSAFDMQDLQILANAG